MIFRHNFFKKLLEPRAFRIGKLTRNTGHIPTGNKNKMPPSQGNLAGQARALMANRILGDLHQHGIPGFQGLLNAPVFTRNPGGFPIHFPGVKDRVTTLTDIHESGFHRGQHILHPPQVHIANHGNLGMPRHVMLDEHIIFEHRDLVETIAFAHDHVTLDRFAPRQVFHFCNGTAPARRTLAVFAAPGPLGGQASGAPGRRHFIIGRKATTTPAGGRYRSIIRFFVLAFFRGGVVVLRTSRRAGRRIMLATFAPAGAPGGRIIARIGICAAGRIVINEVGDPDGVGSVGFLEEWNIRINTEARDVHHLFFWCRNKKRARRSRTHGAVLRRGGFFRHSSTLPDRRAPRIPCGISGAHNLPARFFTASNHRGDTVAPGTLVPILHEESRAGAGRFPHSPQRQHLSGMPNRHHMRPVRTFVLIF